MRKTFLLSLTTCGAFFFLFAPAPANTVAWHSAGDVLGLLDPLTQNQSPSAGRQGKAIPREIAVPRLHVQEPEVEVEEPEVEIEGPDVEIEAPDIEIPEPQIDLNDLHIEIPELDIDIGNDFEVGDHDDADLNVHEQEKIQKSFSMASTHRSLEIDNVWGSIEVVGTSSDQARLTVNRSTRAESKEKLEQARKGVTLDISQQPDSLKLYVNGPFRCDCHDCYRSREFEGYIVKMDFQLEVPRDIDLKIKTVNEGHVSVRDINGSFVVRNVNGDIQMRNIAGSGSARTVNGPVQVSFRQNPREASEFQTVNGNVELQFTRDLAADFRFKTFNGGVYSDFPVTALPVRPIEGEHHGAKVVFRADRYAGVRVSSGGPQIKVENLNGDIRILENHE
jgi:putative adhesin